MDATTADPQPGFSPLRSLRRSWVSLLVLLGALVACFLLPHLSWYNRSRSARVERGRVARVVRTGPDDRVEVVCPSGRVTFEMTRPSGVFAPQAAREGERVLVRVGASGERSLGPKVRETALFGLIVAFAVVLAVAGGPRAVRTALSLAAAFLLLLVVLVPLAIRGVDPLAVAVPLALAIATGTILVVVGVNRKSAAALLGTMGGLVLAVVVSALASRWLSFTGLSVDFGSYKYLGTIYWQSEHVGRVNFAHLLVAGVVLSCLGAAMDVAISVATSVHEVVANRPDISRREAARAGMSVGRAAVWMTAATLFFVLFGAGLEPFLARSLSGGAGLARLLSFEEIAVEVVRLVTAGLTMTLVAPLTALLSGLLMARARRVAATTEPATDEPLARSEPRVLLAGRLARVLVVIGAGLVLVLGLVLLDRLALRSVPIPADKPDGTGYIHEQALGRVLKVRGDHVEWGSEKRETRERPMAWQLVACQLLSGTFAGRVVLCENLVHPNPGKNLVVREGEPVVVELAARRVITTVNLRNPALRYRALLWLLGVLFLALLAFGGWRSARNSLGVLAIVAAILAVVFPLLARGTPPLATMAGFSAAVVVGVLLLFYGWDRKALAALAGTLGALLVVAAVTLLASYGLRLDGLEGAAARWLFELHEHGGILLDYRGLLLAGLLVAVVGVAIDTSVSIAAGIEELYRSDPAIDRRRALASGLAIGRDVMGVCATTFVFASIGVRLPILLLPAAADLAPAELVNSEAGCVEMVRILACGIGLLAAAPLTTLAAVAIFSRRAARPRAARTRSAGLWLHAALCVESALAVGLLVLIQRSPPHAPQPRPRFSSLATGTFATVQAEGDALLEKYDYPRTALLLWRAEEQGIAPGDVAVALARLYLNYENYVRYYEQSGMSVRVEPRGRGAEGRAAGGWAVHAQAELRRALAVEPDHFGANFALGQLLGRHNRCDEAIPLLRKALEHEPDHVELLCDLSGALTMAQQFAEAEAIARRLQRLAPHNERVKQLLDALRAPEGSARQP